MNDRMSKTAFFQWLDVQIPNADDLRRTNPWFAYEAAKREVKRNLAKSWGDYDYYQKMMTFWAGVYK